MQLTTPPPATLQHPENALQHRPFLAQYISGGKIHSNLQLEEALRLVRKLGTDPIDTGVFDSVCGVGVVVDADAIKAGVAAMLDAAEGELKEEGWVWGQLRSCGFRHKQK